MKNLTLGFLVFITTFLNAQSVDPETFPTVVGAIGSKNLYTNTGGEGKVSIKAIMDSVDILDTATITYADFYTLITGGNLVVGKTYIIMDFQTVYDQMDFDNFGALKGSLVTKTGGVEQIWVLALAPNQIASQAYSATYPNDKIQYDWTYNTTLVNGSPAKGRISERIDDNNNRTDYDHREIKFIRYDDGSGNFTVINDNGNASGEFLTFVQNFTGGIVYDNWLGDFYSIGALYGQEYANNVFAGGFVVSNKSSSTFYSNTFSSDVYNNTFSGEIALNIFYSDFLWNNIFSSLTSVTSNGAFSSNIIMAMSSCTFGGDVFKNNIIGGFVQNNLQNGMVNCFVQGDFSNCTLNHLSPLSNVHIEGEFNNKTIDDVTYPFLFNTDYKKEI